MFSFLGIGDAATLGQAAPPSVDSSQGDARRTAITDSIGIKLVLVPAGEFSMGNHDSDEKLAKAFPAIEQRRVDELFDEKPVHRVRITKPFYMAAHEATIGQFKKFVDDAHYQSEAERDGTGGWGYNAAKNDFEGRKANTPGVIPGSSRPTTIL